MRKRRDLMDVAAARLDIPRECLPGGFGLSMSGQGELTVRGRWHILSYSDAEIALRVGERTLRVRGCGLLLAAFEAGAVTVTGEISSLCFERCEE